MTDHYKKHTKTFLALDCIIFGFDQDQLKILVIKRDFEPEKGKWSLMGGFLGPKETLDEAASRILLDLTGLHDIYLEQLKTFSDLKRDPVERTVSTSYYALINICDHNEELSKRHAAEWFDIQDCPPLIFDHEAMVQHAIRRLRYRASAEPIGFELLPEKFTMRQLQKLYEAILGQELDKRNFIKKILSLDVLIKLDEKDRTSSRKGSYLYQFDAKKYDRFKI